MSLEEVAYSVIRSQFDASAEAAARAVGWFYWGEGGDQPRIEKYAVLGGSFQFERMTCKQDNGGQARHNAREANWALARSDRPVASPEIRARRAS